MIICSFCCSCDPSFLICVHAQGDNVCSSDEDCDGLSYCDRRSSDQTGVCYPVRSVGDRCDPASPTPGCARGTFCATPKLYGPLGPDICTALNSVPIGQTVFAEYDSVSTFFYSPSAAAAQLCSSGLGIAIPDLVTGYPSTQVLCVSEVDFSEEGLPCKNCEWAGPPGSALPLSANGALVCAPTLLNSTVTCTLLPASLLSPVYLSGAVSLNACLNAARAPGGQPCPPGRISVASCASVACWGERLALNAAVGATTVIKLWQQNFPELFGSPPSDCYAAAQSSVTAYQILLEQRGHDACPLSEEFFAAGWNCSNMSAPLTLSGSASPSSSSSCSPSQFTTTPATSNSPSPSKVLSQNEVIIVSVGT